MRKKWRKRTYKKEEKWADQEEPELEKRQSDELDVGMIIWWALQEPKYLKKCDFSYFCNVTFQSLKMKCECVTDKQEKQGDQGREFCSCVGPMPALNYIPYINLD